MKNMKLSTHDTCISDVTSFHFNLDEIKKHTHHYSQQVAETQARHSRMQDKWRKNRQLLHQRTQWPAELIQQWQLEKVSALVDYAYNCIPFYRKLYHSCGFRTGDIVSWDDFNALPHVTKQDLIANYPNHVLLQGVDPDDCYQARTSGSTGVPMTIIRDDVTTESWMMNRMRQFEQMSGEELAAGDWIYNIYLSTWAFNSINGDYPTFSVSEQCPAAVIAAHLKLLKPKVMSVFPSFLSRLEPHISDLNHYGLKCICTNSESSSRHERDHFQTHFGVPVLDEYASEELSIIATECKHGHYHIVEDRVRVDVINEDEQGFGDILGTDLSNIYMPMIRYAQGDLIQLKSHQPTCACGSNFRYIDRFLGRSDQALESEVAGRIPADQMMNLCDRTLVTYASGIAAFRVIQSRVDGLQLLLVLRADVNGANQTILEQFRQGVYELFQSEVDVAVEYHAVMPKLSSYKRRMVINEISK